MRYYAKNAELLFQQYQALSAKRIHSSWHRQLPGEPGLACDIGAGSGRDAVWLARQGWDVVAVEPCAQLRRLGEKMTGTTDLSPGGVDWLDDSLPDLKRVRALDQRFQLILLSAVWMHLPASRHARAMRIISDLLAPGGMLVISLRNGPDEEGRFHPTSPDEVIQHARNRALMLLRREHIPDSRREQISWDYLVFRLPDDGTGSLPLLRHIIVNDNKTASYKLGLLRALVRIAESAPGMVIKRTDDYVEIPFGLVGLYWLKIYKPLVLTHNMIQAPGADHEAQRGYGWAGADFYSLHDLSPYDLRVGAVFDPDTAPRVIGAIRDACRNIGKMPAHYITYPGRTDQVFECGARSPRWRHGHWQVTRDSLQDFGSFRIPAALWQCFSQFACWLEPAILNEWVSLMKTWNYQYDASVYDKALQWDEGRRDTTQVRRRIGSIQASGRPVSCVWTQVSLREKYEVDHCFPWRRWFNNDLWNLLPASIRANAAKSDKLPSAALLQESRQAIMEWWEEAYLGDGQLARQFFMEAEAALPSLEQNSPNLDQVFKAMRHQRAKLRASQQLAEWHP